MSVSPGTFKIYCEIKGCKNSNANSKGFEPKYAAFAKKLTSDVKNVQISNLNSLTHTFSFFWNLVRVKLKGEDFQF